MTGPGDVKKRYEKLSTLRNPVLDRARQCSKLTIPSLIPPVGCSSTTPLPTPYQSLGSRGLNNLSSKLLLTTLPPNSPFYKICLDQMLVDQITANQGEDMKNKIDESLGKMERVMQDDIDASNIRPTVSELFKHLLCGGNVVMYVLPYGGMRIYPLEQYVCKRDPEGTLLELILLERVTAKAIRPGIRAACQIEESRKDDAAPFELYTHIEFHGDRYFSVQELNGFPVPESGGDFPKDALPWRALRWTKIDGEDYGRGFIEEYLGDLISLEGLMKAIVMASAAAAKVIFLVRPNSSTKHKDIVTAESGDVKPGSPDDVGVVQMEKYADFRIALETISMLERRLSHAFMLNSAVQREGERVTAEEIRFMAGELEDTLGGAYSLLSAEFQHPLIHLVMGRLQRQGRLPMLPDKSLKVKIVTGMEALGRKHDQDKLNLLLAHLQPLGPEVLATYLKVGGYITRTATNLGVDLSGLVRTDEEVAEMQKAAQQKTLMENITPEVIKQAGPIIQDMVKKQGNQTK